MKQQTTKPDSTKEVLQDKWEVSGNKIMSDNFTREIARVVSYNHEADAELIVKAVNNYQSLVDALEWCKAFFISTDSKSYFKGIDENNKDNNIYKAIETALNNSK